MTKLSILIIALAAFTASSATAAPAKRDMAAAQLTCRMMHDEDGTECNVIPFGINIDDPEAIEMPLAFKRSLCSKLLESMGSTRFGKGWTLNYFDGDAALIFTCPLDGSAFDERANDGKDHLDEDEEAFRRSVEEYSN